MNGFSIGQAVGAGFRLIGRHPLAVLAWAVAYVVLGVVPYLLIVSMTLPDMMSLMQEAERSAGGGEGFNLDGMLAMQARMMVFQPLFLLLYLVTHSVMLGAIYRAVLTPEDNRFLYLRLGRRELWLGLSLAVFLVALLLFCLLLIVPVGVGAGLTAAAASQGGSGTGALWVILLPFAAVAAVVWVVLRFSLGLAMSWSQSRFALFDSWTLTRGQDWRLIGAALLLLVIAWGLELVIGGVAAAVVLGVVAGGGLAAAIQAADPQEVIRLVLPWALGLLPVLAVLGTGLYVVMAAPFADIYRQLAGDEAVAGA